MVLDFRTEGWNGQFHYLIVLSFAELDQEGSIWERRLFRLLRFHWRRLISAAPIWRLPARRGVFLSLVLHFFLTRLHDTILKRGASYVPLRFCRIQFHIYNQIGITIGNRIRRIMWVGTRSSLAQRSHQFSPSTIA